jgi:hypothetical protein
MKSGPPDQHGLIPVHPIVIVVQPGFPRRSWTHDMPKADHPARAPRAPERERVPVAYLIEMLRTVQASR